MRRHLPRPFDDDADEILQGDGRICRIPRNMPSTKKETPMIGKLKLSAKERRAGVDLRDLLGHRTPRRKPAESTAPDDKFRPIEYIETTLHDPIRDRWEKGSDEGGVRIYRTANPTSHGYGRWALQVRAQVKTKHGPGKHFAVGTASMSRVDLQWLRDQINAELRRKS
jgi:hypothetical protein